MLVLIKVPLKVW